MQKVKLSLEKCKACYYCIQFCPKDAISISGERNEKGYQTVKVDQNKCIQCGICYMVCPDYVFEILERVKMEKEV